MVELATINKALPGDSPDSQKKKTGASSTSHFFLNKVYTLRCSKSVESFLFPPLCFLLNKNRYKNKCGGDLSKSPISNSSRSLHQTCCTSSTVQHAKEQDRRNPRKDGRAFSSTKPPLASYSSFFFLFSNGMCNTSLTKSLKLPKFLSLIEFIY